MVARKMPIGIVLLILLLLLIVLLVAACSSADTSKSRSRSVIESGRIVPSEELRVAEYLSYYTQKFPEPVDSTLGLDLRLGNAQVPVDGGPAWLQVGIQARSAETEIVGPLNLAIVIDRSGSMDSPEKMPYVKESLRVFLRGLDADDIVALVVFSDGAEAIMPATKVGDGSWIESAVARLEPGGSTNLHAGMMLGFEEVERNFDVRRNNRVILLTDGIANRGVTDPEEIASAARGYNERGIYLSTIGLGHEFNDSLLSKLATQGKGAYHFIDSAAEMDKVFRQEVSGLVQKAASDVVVVIRPEPSVTVEAVTGYEGRPPSGPIQVRVRDMGTGDSQVLLAHLTVDSGQSGRRDIVTVELRYQDLFSKREEVITRQIVADASRLSSYDPTWDVEVLRNVTIQRTAEGLKEIDQLYRAQRYSEAWELAHRLEQDLRSVAQLTNDPQMVQDADLMRKYQGTLANWVEYQTGRGPQSSERSGTEQPSREHQPTTPNVPVLDIK